MVQAIARALGVGVQTFEDAAPQAIADYKPAAKGTPQERVVTRPRRQTP